MGKRIAAASAAGASNGGRQKQPRLPTLASMTATVVGTGSSQKRADQDERLYLTCFSYCTHGSAYNDQVFDAGRLVQIQMTCNAVHSPMFSIIQLVTLYGQAEKSREPDKHVPTDMESLTRQYGVQFVHVGKNTTDPDGVGFKVWRAGWYVSSTNLKAFLMYFDDLTYFRSTLSNNEYAALGGEISQE